MLGISAFIRWEWGREYKQAVIALHPHHSLAHSHPGLTPGPPAQWSASDFPKAPTVLTVKVPAHMKLRGIKLN